METANDKKIKYLFCTRVCLWVVALIATVYWIYWSFHIYTLGVIDEHEYAAMFRPVFVKALGISLAAIGISFILRFISDGIKDSAKNYYD